MRPLRVVVIDDDPNTCSFLKAVLTAEGHTCDVMLRAEDAERHMAQNPTDLAMVDVYLGSTNGIDLLQRLRTLQPNLYPVIMTAHVSVETAARSLSEGAVDYVSKPLTIEQIRSITERADKFRFQSREETPVIPAEVRNPPLLDEAQRCWKSIKRLAGWQRAM